jgi:hypothetical protein
VAAHATVEKEALAGPVRFGPCAVHYLSIPGQVQDSAGVMRFVAEGETPHAEATPEDAAGQTGEDRESPPRDEGGEPTFL